jgi:glucose-6-phosphate 1-dehydrogenase
MPPLKYEDVGRIARFGQYRGYTREKDVPSQSKTETAVAFKLEVANDRWRGVPIYVRAGKQLKRSVTEITIQFKPNKKSLFNSGSSIRRPTALTLRIGPNEGVIIHLAVKKPGLDFKIDEVPMQFCYKNEYQMDLVEAYVKLINDAIAGDITLFQHADGIETSWQYVEPLLHHVQSPAFVPELYDQGSWGPESFEGLLIADGRSWLEPSEAVCQISNFKR